MTDNLLSTKFIFAMAALICGVVLTALRIVTGQEFFSFVEIIGGTYVIGNVAQKFITQK